MRRRASKIKQIRKLACSARGANSNRLLKGQHMSITVEDIKILFRIASTAPLFPEQAEWLQIKAAALNANIEASQAKTDQEAKAIAAAKETTAAEPVEGNPPASG